MQINMQMDEIRIENLQVYARHGVYPQEKELGQSFYISATLYTDTRRAGRTDKLEESTNYGEVCLTIQKWMEENTCNLIETVAESLAAAILLKYDLIKKVQIQVKKPNAPIPLPFGNVSVVIERGWHRVYLALGSNMGDRRMHLEQGIAGLKAYTEIRVRKISDYLVTKPYGGVEQEDFLNGALELDTLFTPRELLEVLHGIEAFEGRERLVHWGPRTLDLDILFYDALVYEDEDLIIPHVDMQNRYFVLKPLSQIAPNLRHPLSGKTVSRMLADCITEERAASDTVGQTAHTSR